MTMSMSIAYFKPFINWLHLNPNWAGLIVFFVAFCESFAVIGLIAPGSVLMTAIGGLVGAKILPGIPICLFAIAGAFLGDFLSFLLGRHYHLRIRSMWPFRSHPHWLIKGEQFFFRHGGKSIFLGRFIGPIRPFTPIIAGMLNMNIQRFILIDSFSAILWAPIYMLPGYLLGAASTALTPDAALKLMISILILLLLIWVLAKILNRLFWMGVRLLSRVLDAFWRMTKDHPLLKPVYVLLRDPSSPDTHTQLNIALAFVFIGLVFLAIAGGVKHHGWITYYNAPIHYLFSALRNNLADCFMIGVTYLGEKEMLVFFVLGLSLWFVSQRNYWTAFHWVLNAFIAFSSVGVLKDVIKSLRPGGLINTTGYSFPSGHTTLSTAIYGFLAVIIARELRPENRWIPYFIAINFALLIGFSRLYLGAHWFTDVMGSYLLGLCCVLFCTLSYRRKQNVSVNPQLTVSVAACILLLTWSAYGVLNFYKDYRDYQPYVASTEISLQQWWNANEKFSPIYRTNHFSKPVEMMNVEWNDSLVQISRYLQNKAWKNHQEHSFISSLKNLNLNAEYYAPLLSPLYQGKRPSLVMSKSLDATHILLLRLWASNIVISENHLPLWLGVLSVQNRHDFWEKKKKNSREVVAPVISPIEYLLADLPKNYDRKKIYFPSFQATKTTIVFLKHPL